MNAAAFWGALGLAAGLSLAVATAHTSEPVKACCAGKEHAAEKAAEPDAGVPETVAAQPSAIEAILDAGSPLAAVAAPRGGVQIGAVVFSFESGTRSKTMAKALAEKTMELAARDFAAAVKTGDEGSTTDLGTLPQGTLEADVEAAIVQIAPGQVGGPVETPRSYWVVRRIK